MSRTSSLLKRRAFLAGSGAAFVAAGQGVLAQQVVGSGEVRRVSGFVAYDWRDHFESLENGAILADTRNRYMHFWSEDGQFTKVYPTSVPLTEELTKRGRTKVVRMREGPDWRPTPEMLARNPDLPDYVEPGPLNPLGTHALYLEWENYRIHGTNDIRKIGRKSSSGCIGLFNEHIAEVFARSKVGTQVVLI